LDDPVVEILQLLNLEEFIELLNGCVPDVIVRHYFAILRTLVTTRFLHAAAAGGPYRRGWRIGLETRAPLHF
jgi:hypothetical protein